MMKVQKAYNGNYNWKIELVKDKPPVSIPKKTLAVRTNSYTFLKRFGAMVQASKLIDWLPISTYMELSTAEGFEILNFFSNLTSGLTIGSSQSKSSLGSSIWSNIFSPFLTRLLIFSSKWRLKGQYLLMKQGNILTYCHFPLSWFIQSAVYILKLILQTLLLSSR